jgi:hypothetical protein
MRKHGVYVSKGDFVSTPTFNTHPEAKAFAERTAAKGYTCEVWGEGQGPDYNPDYVVAVLTVHDADRTTTEWWTVFDMGMADQYVVMHDTLTSHRQATPTLTKQSALSYALMQTGWGPLGGWDAHDERQEAGDRVIGLPPT